MTGNFCSDHFPGQNAKCIRAPIKIQEEFGITGSGSSQWQQPALLRQRLCQLLPFSNSYLHEGKQLTGSSAGGLLATCGAAAQGRQREQNWAGVQPGIRAAWKRHPNPSVTMRASGRGGRWTGTALAGVFSTKQTNIWIKLFRKMSQPSDLRAQAASVVPHMSAESSHLFPWPAQGKEKKNQTPDPPAKLDLGF